MEIVDVKHGKRSPESPRNNNYSNNNNNREQDRFLPIANVGRIMKKVVPGNGKISKEAKETVQECVSEFISFVTGEASDKCQREKRKTVNGDDIIWAITTLGFEEYVEPLKLYLVKYKQLEGDKVNNNVPNKQQQCIEQQQQQQHQDSFSTYKSVYSLATTNMNSQQPFATYGDQTFMLPFSSNSIDTQLHHQQDSIDSIEQW